MNRWLRWSLMPVVVIVCLIAALVVMGWVMAILAPSAAGAGAHAASQPAAAAIGVSTGPVIVKPAQRFVELTGNLLGDEELTISAKVPGRVSAVFQDRGDRLSPGTMLAQIEATDYELAAKQKELAVSEALAKLGLKTLPEGEPDIEQIATVQRAKVQAENAEARYERGKKLHEQKPPLLSEQDYKDLETAAAVAKSNYEVEKLTAESVLADARSRAGELAMAKQRVGDAEVRTPPVEAWMTGRAATRAAEGTGAESRGPLLVSVATRYVATGEYVKEGTPMFRLIIDDPVKLVAAAPEAFVNKVKVGQPVDLRIESTRTIFHGTITRKSPEIDRTNRTFQVEAKFPNASHELTPGAYARANALTGSEDALYVPRDAVVTFAGENKVFTVKNGVANEVRVKLGPSQGDLVEVTEVLTKDAHLGPGDVVVITGVSKLAPGAPVTVQTTTAANSVDPRAEAAR